MVPAVPQLATNLGCRRSKLRLRRAGTDDSAFAYRAKKAAFRQYVEQAWGWDEKEQFEWHRARYHHQDFRIIEVAGVDVGIIADGFTDVEYIEPNIAVVDETSAVVSSKWRMNKAHGVITKELWVMQNDGTALLREDDFEVLG